MMLLDSKNKIIMGWSAKAGCTVSIMMFFDHMGILQEALQYNSWLHQYRQNVFYKKFGHVTNKEFNDPEYFKFKVVRNPYERAISSFLGYAAQIGKISFVEYLSLLEKKGLRAFDIHHQKQWDGKKYDKIVKIENIKNDIKEINEKLNTSFKTDYSSWHHHTKLERKNEFVGDLTFTGKFDIPIPHYDDFYNNDLRKNVAKIYHEDFAYGYPK